MRESIVLPVLELSQVGEARRVATALAEHLCFNGTEQGKVGIVVTEMAKNLMHHAKEGLLLLQEVQKQRVMGLEILSLDKGPGIDNLDECLRDGFSTRGTSGNGMGAIRRLSHFFEIHSIPNVGTAMVAHFWASPLSNSPRTLLDIGAICLPRAGEEVSGDAWASQERDRRSLLLVADGLGHGLLAAEASLKAVKVFEEQSDRGPKAILEAAHDALRSTRGAVLAIAQIDVENQSVRFAGVGNIAGSILSVENHCSLVSHNGTVGHAVRKVQEFTYQWHSGALLVMHSDGLGTQWRLDRYPGLAQNHPSLIAGVLYRDFYRGRDDVTVLVAREGR